MNTVALKKSDYEKLSSAAKGYVNSKKAEIENINLKSEVRSLQAKNETLKKENDIISGQLHNIDYNYGRYYAETANERELLEENKS